VSSQSYRAPSFAGCTFCKIIINFSANKIFQID
jgi:hypothetical protein